MTQFCKSLVLYINPHNNPFPGVTKWQCYSASGTNLKLQLKWSKTQTSISSRKEDQELFSCSFRVPNILYTFTPIVPNTGFESEKIFKLLLLLVLNIYLTHFAPFVFILLYLYFVTPFYPIIRCHPKVTGSILTLSIFKQPNPVFLKIDRFCHMEAKSRPTFGQRKRTCKHPLHFYTNCTKLWPLQSGSSCFFFVSLSGSSFPPLLLAQKWSNCKSASSSAIVKPCWKCIQSLSESQFHG